VRSLRRSPAKHIDLLPQDQVFRFQRCSRLEARSQDTENQPEQIGHQDASLRRPLAASTPNRIFGTHSIAASLGARVQARIGPDVTYFIRLTGLSLPEPTIPAPFSRRIANPLNADAPGQVTLYGCFDKIECDGRRRIAIFVCSLGTDLSSANLSNQRRVGRKS
jgi:hypothetical protein